VYEKRKKEKNIVKVSKLKKKKRCLKVEKDGLIDDVNKN
jgi:hypothetical protein